MHFKRLESRYIQSSSGCFVKVSYSKTRFIVIFNKVITSLDWIYLDLRCLKCIEMSFRSRYSHSFSSSCFLYWIWSLGWASMSIRFWCNASKINVNSDLFSDRRANLLHQLVLFFNALLQKRIDIEAQPRLEIQYKMHEKLNYWLCLLLKLISRHYFVELYNRNLFHRSCVRGLQLYFRNSASMFSKLKNTIWILC